MNTLFPCKSNTDNLMGQDEDIATEEEYFNYKKTRDQDDDHFTHNFTQTRKRVELIQS